MQVRGTGRAHRQHRQPLHGLYDISHNISHDISHDIFPRKIACIEREYVGVIERAMQAQIEAL